MSRQNENIDFEHINTPNSIFCVVSNDEDRTIRCQD